MDGMDVSSPAFLAFTSLRGVEREYNESLLE